MPLSAHLRPGNLGWRDRSCACDQASGNGRRQAVARLFRAVRRAFALFADLHTPDQDLGFFRGRVFAECEMWLDAGRGD